MASVSIRRDPSRRTQEERRTRTRAKLLDATIESLIEVGYEATTTRAVAHRAGVSSGAQTHHFPRRVDLVAAAIEHLTEQRIAAMRAAAAELPTDTEEGVRALLDLLWADFSGPLFKVFVKLWIAADDDAELYERLVPLERVLARVISQSVAELGGELVRGRDRKVVDARMATVLATLRGLALSDAFEPRRRRPGNQWALVRPMLERAILFQPPGGD
jgi:AcrR family transcriptional regulator